VDERVEKRIEIGGVMEKVDGEGGLVVDVLQ